MAGFVDWWQFIPPPTEAGVFLPILDKITIYYDHNSWNLTRLGKINGATKEQLLKVLGSGDVTVELSL